MLLASVGRLSCSAARQLQVTAAPAVWSLPLQRLGSRPGDPPHHTPPNRPPPPPSRRPPWLQVRAVAEQMGEALRALSMVLDRRLPVDT